MGYYYTPCARDHWHFQAENANDPEGMGFNNHILTWLCQLMKKTLQAISNFHYSPRRSDNDSTDFHYLPG